MKEFIHLYPPFQLKVIIHNILLLLWVKGNLINGLDNEHFEILKINTTKKNSVVFRNCNFLIIEHEDQLIIKFCEWGLKKSRNFVFTLSFENESLYGRIWYTAGFMGKRLQGGIGNGEIMKKRVEWGKVQTFPSESLCVSRM